MFFALVLVVTILVPLSATGDEGGRPDGTATPTPPAATDSEGTPGADEPDGGWDGDGPAPRVLHAGNVTIDGSACVGNDCNTDPPSPSYSFDTFRLMENNLRILAMDSSGGSFPTRDWQIEFNSTANGGQSYFMVRDCGNTASTGSTCGGTAQLTIEAGADNDSIYVDSSGNQGGNVGFGTTSPVVDLHVLSGNTPTLRLHQDTSSGFGTQTWDVAGNEANFFIRDVTNGSALPIRIEPGTASNTLYLDNQELVGIGTSSPAAALHVRKTDGNASILVEEASGTTAQRDLLALKNNGVTRFTIENTASGEGAWFWYVKNSGDMAFGGADAAGDEIQINETSGAVRILHDLVVDGTFSNPSDENRKSGFAAVDTGEVLAGLAALDVQTWSYNHEDAWVRHMGPTAQDFRAQFGLGTGTTHIALVDQLGVAYAAIQGLNDVVEAQGDLIEALEARVAALEAGS